MPHETSTPTPTDPEAIVESYASQLGFFGPSEATDNPFIGPGGTEFAPNVAQYRVYDQNIPASLYPTTPERLAGPPHVNPDGTLTYPTAQSSDGVSGPPQAVAGPPILHRDIDLRYRADDPQTALFDLSPADLLTVQQQMYEAGLLNEITGRVTPQMITAMGEVMGHANIRGTTWRDQLTQFTLDAAAINDALGRSRRQGGVRATPTFTFDPYLPPDYDTLTTNIEQLFRDHLNRDPEPHELTILADKMTALYRADYDAQYQAALQKFRDDDFVSRQAMVTENVLAEELHATEGEDDVMGEALVNPAATGPTQVDVASSTYQFFKKRYANELDRVEQMRQAALTQELTSQQLLALGQLGAGTVNQL